MGPEPEPPVVPARRTKAGRTEARRGDADVEERRVFWLAVGVFTAVLLVAFWGTQLSRSKDKVLVGPPSAPPVGPMTQPLAETVAPQPEASEGASPVPPQPTAAATTPEDMPADPAPALKSPSADTVRPGRVGSAQASAGSTPMRSAPTTATAPARRATGRGRAPRRLARDDAYIQRLRERIQQYEREKAQGKYQESPQ